MMELSILQHEKDQHPQKIGINEVVARIRDDHWPPGYQPLLLVQGVFEGGTRQDDIVSLSGLSIVRFKADPALLEAVRDDPHTLLAFTSADMLNILYRYEVDTGYEIRLQRQFYKKALLYGNDYYRQQLEQEPVKDGKDVGKRCVLAHDPQAYYNPQADFFLAWEIKEGCRKQTSQPKSTEGLRERKPNYKELRMSLDEIEDWLSHHIQLRRNVISDRQEYRWLENDAIEGRGPWLNYDDHTLNTLYRRMGKVKTVKRDEIDWVVCSDYAKDFDPFRDYLERLPPWDGNDYILGMAAGVTVAGGFDEWQIFLECLRKWFVAMVASWVNPEVVNQMVLVFIGRQGIYKTTWMNHLLPPSLRSYYCTQTGVGRNDKDTELALSQYGLICCEELDAMKDQAMNAMKRAITLNYTNVRGAYQRHAERRPHIASFCGTGNNEKFLNDPTGTRRWLAFKVEYLESPLKTPFDYEGIYAQAYYLYKQGFQYWFEDSEATSQRNSRFQVANLERQLVHRHFIKPKENEPCEFVDVATALQYFPPSVASKIRKEAVDQAFMDLGFQPVTLDGNPGYFAIVRKPEEVHNFGVMMASHALRTTSDEPF